MGVSLKVLWDKRKEMLCPVRGETVQLLAELALLVPSSVEISFFINSPPQQDARLDHPASLAKLGGTPWSPGSTS